jgi:4-carboxymuconolactone decarboxylase
MVISDDTKRNHDQVFGDRASRLAQTDPELIEYFDNFAFGDAPASRAPTPNT